MSLSVFVTYEPDGSPQMSVRTEKRLNLMISRLQNGAEVSREVHSLAKDELRHSLDYYMLFWPERKVWIWPEKPIGLYHIAGGAKLEFRPRKRCLKLRFLDAASKLLIIDVTKPVKRLVTDICEHLRIEHAEELSLVVAGDYAVQKHHPAKNKSVTRVGSASPHDGRKLTMGRKEKSVPGLPSKVTSESTPRSLSPSIRRKRPGSASGSKKPTWNTNKVKKQISKKHQIRLDTPWLDPNKTLAEQEVTENDELILMYRFYYHMELQRGSANAEMLYKQARATYLAGELLCSPNDMVRLSAILCQITKGDYSKHKYNSDFISAIKALIAPPKCKVKGIAKQITSQHSALEGVSVADAKCWFVKLWSSLELFGMEFLSCSNIDTKEKSLIGVSKDKITFLYHKNKKNTFWDIDKLTHWTQDVSKDTVTLTFSRDKQTEVLNLSLPDYSGVLVDCLQGHREVSDTIPDIMRPCSEYQFDDEMESAISVFATQTKRDAKVRRALNSLTYEDVYWASKIENPLLSAEELSRIRSDSWENPVFANMEQLMDERFNFLDFEPSDDPSQQNGGGSDSAAGQASPSHLRTVQFTSSMHHTTNKSPLIISRTRVQSSPQLTRLHDEDTDSRELVSHQMFHNRMQGDRKISSESSSSDGGAQEVGGVNSGVGGATTASDDGEGPQLPSSKRKDSNSGLPELMTVRS